MRSSGLIRAARAATAVALLGLTVGAATLAARPVPERPRARRALNLFAVTNAVLDVNRVYCGINNLGELCVDPTNSPVLGGGFWPKGTPMQYIFNSGLQLAGRVDPGAGFAWAGDTIGAFFFDARGTQVQGDAITLVYNSLDGQDAAAWPNGAVVRDTSLYHPSLIGLDNISQQDLWTRAWDGNPAFLSGRTHPMGILVEERGLAWNFPTGNEDIIYFVFTFTNITARNLAAYNNSTIHQDVRSEIHAIGVDFQNRNEAAFNLDIPDNGYAIQDLFAAFSMDPDVGDAAHNYSTAVLPFQMAMAYKADFLEEDWLSSMSGDIFGAPFTKAPGFVGVKYLRAPSPRGLTMFSNTRNATDGFPDPVGVRQLYRYLSGAVGAGDNPCTVSNPQQRGLCFLDQLDVDTRFYQASGPFVLPAGESRTIVVAYVHAAPLALVDPFIGAVGGAQMKPAIPSRGDQFATGDTARTIERAAGWISHSDINDNDTIEQAEVRVEGRSLLQKALVAQAVYDAKFLLPDPPAAPRFFTIPGNNEVTVVWQPSTSETNGDLFYGVASQPFDGSGNPSPTYDPNYRQFDVEGYRIYRGRTTGDLELIAQFDYAGTEMIDYTGAFDYGNCAPELGVFTDCPVPFDTTPPQTAPSASHSLVGPVVQVPAGGRVELANGSILILTADTAVTGGGSGNPPLEDRGVGFAFTDRSVRNSFRYYYAVTAFDVNSQKSGFSSLESAPAPVAVTPRASSGQAQVGALAPIELVGSGNTVIPAGSPPDIVAATGIFTGPHQPTNGVALGLVAFLPEVLGTGSVTLIIDSVVPGDAQNGDPMVYYVRGQGAGAPVAVTIPLTQDFFDGDATNSAGFQATTIDGGKAGLYGGDSTFALYGSATMSAPGTWKLTSWGRGSINGAPANSDYNGPRWWAGSANENTPDPNSSHCPTSPGGCVQTPLTKTAGALPGVDVLFHLLSYNTVPNVPMRAIEGVTSGVTRAADFRVYWGAAGVVDSVIDVTHRVPVSFADRVRASWGILRAASFGGVPQAATADGNNALLTWSDIGCVAPLPTSSAGVCTGAAATPALLQSSATLDPIAATASTYAGTSALAQTGTGFIFYLNGHFFLMQMTALPAATVWNARFYAGTIIGTAGSYQFEDQIRPPAVPGLRARVTYTGSTLDASVTSDSLLALVHTVPDPYYVTNELETSPNTKILNFVKLPAQSIIRIYSVSGVLVQVLYHNDPTGGGEQTWNLRNRNNQFVASGVYFYHVETPDGKKKVGRFTVVNFAQ